MNISPRKIRIFPCFKTAISIDKPVNRSKYAYAVTHLNFIAFRGLFFHNILKKQGRGLTKSDCKIQKKKRQENVLAYAHLRRKTTQIEY